MITDRVADGLLSRKHRPDVATSGTGHSTFPVHGALVAAIAIGFVLIGAAGLEPNSVEGRLGLAASEPFGPFGQVLGGYDPSLSPGIVAICHFWAVLEGGTPSTGAIRWPFALAAVGIGLVLSHRVRKVMGPRASVFAALASLATLGLMDRSALASETIMGLAVIATLDRLLTRGSDWGSGCLAALAFLVGGWPALVAILLPVIVLGKPTATLSVKLLVPPLLAFSAWSAWAWTEVRFEVWAATLTFPITQKWSWNLIRWAALAGLPWSPLALFVALPSTRASWSNPTRQLVTDWLKVAVLGLLVGLIVPGMSGPGTFLIFAGLVFAVTPILESAWTNSLPRNQTWAGVAVVLLVGIYLAARSLVTGANLAIAQPYYRALGIVVIGLSATIGMAAVDGAWTRSSRSIVRTLFLLAVLTKLIHAGYHQPETSYRFGKGPWGRAIGQHVPPKWPIFVFHSVDPALAFATERPVRQLRAGIFLKAQPSDHPNFVLLTDSEFEHWPIDAPAIQKVRSFQDEYGGVRVLARTEGRMIRLDRD